MQVFDQYAYFYDAYYADKDYDREVDFVLSLARQHGTQDPKSILDIGCGTGGHLMPFCKRGFDVKGIDQSERMIEIARQKIASGLVGSKAIVEVGDATTFRDKRKYDLVISMFAVMGYLASNEEFLAGLRTARAHLDPGGLFIFDIWFGPAVLHIVPEPRVQEFIKDGLRTFRIARPALDVVRQVVKVDYTLLAIDGQKVAKEIKETHTMRYFFAQELKFFLVSAGFELAKICPFLDLAGEVSSDSWNVTVVATAK